MVKKLFKYEFSHYIRSLFPFFIIPPIAALIARIIWFFRIDDVAFEIASGSSMFMFTVSLILCSVMVFITAISRYYKNLFSAQGYLTMTLPVKPATHIFVKLMTAVIFTFFTAVLAFLSFCILIAGPNIIELFKTIGYVLSKFYGEFGFETVLFIIEFILAMICTVVYNILVYYSCISIGHLAKKNKVLAAFGVYFLYYIITQVISTIFTIIISVYMLSYQEFMMNLIRDVGISTLVHIAFWIVIVVISGLSVAFFFINKGIMKNKLNLE